MSTGLRLLKQAAISIVFGILVDLGLSIFLRFVLQWDSVDIGTFPQSMGTIACLTSLGVQFALPAGRPTVTVAKAERELALASPPPAGLAVVYVSRTGFIGKAMGLNVVLDGLVVAFLRTPRFTRLTVVPGQHVLTIQASTKEVIKRAASPFEFTVAAGETAVLSFTARVKGEIPVVREPDPASALRKLAGVPMVAPDPDTANMPISMPS